MNPASSRILTDDKFHDECGVFGVWNVPDAAAVTALGLHALQHRGQEVSGHRRVSTAVTSTPTGGWAWSATISAMRA